MTESVATESRWPHPITVVGDRSIALTTEMAQSLPSEDLTADVVCATGNRYDATWTGIGIESLCDVAEADAETTHVVFGSRDGYRIAVPILDALAGVLAFAKDGRPISEQAPYFNRFVAPDVEGARDVKGVERVEFHALAPDADPERLEQVEPDDDRYESDRETDQAGSQTQ